MFPDGILDGADTDSYGAIASRTGNIGNYARTDTEGWIGDIAMAAVVGRALSNAEIAAWSKDPFALFRKPRRIAVLAPQAAVTGGLFRGGNLDGLGGGGPFFNDPLAA